jgi:hypothetical protein
VVVGASGNHGLSVGQDDSERQDVIKARPVRDL